VGNAGRVKVRFAFSAMTTAAGGDLAALVDGAEAAGFDSLWFSDLTVLGEVDPLLAVAYAAARSTRLHLGVNLVPFGRQPYVLARQLAQLDQLSGGRLLVTVVPGLGLAEERAALGVTGAHRGRRIDGILPQLRAWWAGETVEVDGVAVRQVVLPRQQPLEVWLGGSGPEAVARAGRLADGWLGSFLTPADAGRIRRAVQAAAADAGRTIDPEHFGLSIAYARAAGDLDRVPRRLPRRPGTPTPPPVPVGRDALRAAVAALVDEGLSKFVVRPVAPAAGGIDDDLAWAADALLDLQG